MKSLRGPDLDYYVDYSKIKNVLILRFKNLLYKFTDWRLHV